MTTQHCNIHPHRPGKQQNTPRASSCEGSFRCPPCLLVQIHGQIHDQIRCLHTSGLRNPLPLARLCLCVSLPTAMPTTSRPRRPSAAKRKEKCNKENKQTWARRRCPQDTAQIPPLNRLSPSIQSFSLSQELLPTLLLQQDHLETSAT